jgi:hypothetical protein
MSLARVGTPTQAIPSRLQRVDASFELAPNTAMMITGMYMAILNNTVHLVQVSCLIERGLGNPIMKPRRRRISPNVAAAGTFAACASGHLLTNVG